MQREEVFIRSESLDENWMGRGCCKEHERPLYVDYDAFNDTVPPMLLMMMSSTTLANDVDGFRQRRMSLQKDKRNTTLAKEVEEEEPQVSPKRLIRYDAESSFDGSTVITFKPSVKSKLITSRKIMEKIATKHHESSG